MSAEAIEVIKTAHGVYRLQYHVVWVCKYRRRILNPRLCDYLKKVIAKLLRSMSGVLVEMIGFDQNHLYMLMVIPPKYSIAKVMGQLKNQSSFELRERFSWLGKVYWKENVVWSPGYFVSSLALMRKR